MSLVDTSACRVVVVGAGPAGMMAAATAAASGLAVTLLEKNTMAGKKLLITGKGRCNVTTSCEKDRFFEQIPRNPKFLYAAYAAFDNRDTMALFERLGVPLKVERGERVFPQSDRSADVRDALVRHCKEQGVTFLHGRAVSLLAEDGAIVGVKTQGAPFPCEAVVLATGGLSYPATGSTGDGYRMAQELGHTIVPPRPSLVPIVTWESWTEQAMGLSLRNVSLSLWREGEKRPLYRGQGELLFTHFGLSGPLVLTASAFVREGENYRIAIDCKPALSHEQLDARLVRDFSEIPNKDFSHALDKLLPRKLIPIVVALSGISPQCKVHSISREQRRQLVDLVKALPLTVKGLRPMEEAIVTAGGVSTKEVDPKTMQSKLVKGLFFSGELLDLDAMTGGFNLQIAFSTGYLAGRSVERALAESWA